MQILNVLGQIDCVVGIALLTLSSLTLRTADYGEGRSLPRISRHAQMKPRMKQHSEYHSLIFLR
ncbi:MAG: hypothetical protein M3N19_00065 [Candidatus Eremiobacteraeota bacterium]|nr:hypothetical protein [Candidatus Eremiobacteraeota bacterium]